MTRRSTLYHVDGERGFRGGERQLLYLASALRARGRRNVIYCRAGQDLEAEAGRQGFETRTLPFLNEWDILSASRLAADARREGAVIHAHTGHAAGVGSLAALAGVPFVAHRRVDFSVGFLARALKYGRAGRTVAVSSAIAKILRDAGLPSNKISVVPDGIPATTEECAWVQVEKERFKPAPSEQKKEYRRALA
ncbi:MAG: glycosyltransferase, partial [Elusimicrobia bacterium]|nr:glycosyltransferase [Elusimicrobiota bacterium]